MVECSSKHGGEFSPSVSGSDGEGRVSWFDPAG